MRLNAGVYGVLFDRIDRRQNNPKVTGINRLIEILFMPGDADDYKDWLSQVDWRDKV
jgi:hypothetical protein